MRLVVVVLATLVAFTPETMALKVAEAYLGDSVLWEPAEPITLSTEELQPFAGAYHSEELDITYVASAADGELQVTFIREGEREVGLQADGGRVRHLRFARVHV